MAFEFLGLVAEQWLDLGISLLIMAAALILGRWVVRVLLDKGIRRVTGRTKTTLDDAIVDSLRLPLYWLAVVLVCDIALARLDFLLAAWEIWTDGIFYVLYWGIGFAFILRFANNFFDWYGLEMAARTETDLDEQLMPFFRRVVAIILWVVGIITLLGHFGVDVSAMLATLGVGSLAIALAAKDTLADTISGFIIMIDRPFRIGDRIEIRDLGTWGDVIDIGLRSSRIRTRDNRTVIVPNSVIAKSLVVNHSYPDTQYRIQVHVGVAYGTELELARQTMIEAVRGVEGVLPDHKVEALFLEFGDSALIFRVRWWIDSYVDTRRMFNRVNTAIYNALNDAGIEIPCPQVGVRLVGGGTGDGGRGTDVRVRG